jgi:hypothetical protein
MSTTDAVAVPDHSESATRMRAAAETVTVADVTEAALTHVQNSMRELTEVWNAETALTHVLLAVSVTDETEIDEPAATWTAITRQLPAVVVLVTAWVVPDAALIAAVSPTSAMATPRPYLLRGGVDVERRDVPVSGHVAGEVADGMGWSSRTVPVDVVTRTRPTGAPVALCDPTEAMTPVTSSYVTDAHTAPCRSSTTRSVTVAIRRR